MRITGMFAPVPTPFTTDEEIYFDKLGENLDRLKKTGLAGVVVLGSNGEFVSLTHEEKVKTVSFVTKNISKDKLVIAGTGCESTKETIQITRESADLGVDAALVVNPTYFKGSLTEEALEAHYTKVADASPIPVMIYNMPPNTGINMSANLQIKLSKHPNIAGVKDSGGNIVQISKVIKGTPEDFSVFAGSGSYLLPTLLMGGVGATMAVANVVPNYCVEIGKLFQEGNIEKAREMQLDLLGLNNAVTRGYGIPGLKYAMDQIGYFGGPVRSPLLAVTDSQKKEIDRLLDEIDAKKWC